MDRWMTSVGAAVAAVGTLIAAPGVALAGDVTIADVAPPDAMLVMGADDFAAAREAFERTGFADAMNDPSFQAWFKDVSADMMEDIASMLEQVDADMEDLQMPTGPAGVAVWLEAGDEESPEPTPQIMMLGDFGEHADRLHEMVLSAVERGEEDGTLEIERDTIRDVEMLAITEVPQETEDDGAGGDDEWEDWEDWDTGDSGPSIETLHYARSGGYLMAMSSKDRLERSIERLAGDELDSIGGDEDFRTGVARLGEQDGYMVFLPRPLMAMAEAADEANAGMGMQIMPILDSLGVTEIRSFSAGVEFDADSGMAESRALLRVPQMRGLMSMFDAPASDFTPPAFVDADVAEFAMYQFDVSQLFDVVRGVMAVLPPEMAGQAAMLPMVEGMMGPLLANIGPEIYMATSYIRPFSPESQEMLMAMKVKDEIALGGFLGQSAAGIGMMGREFQGGQIWTMPEGGNPMMPLPTEIGLGLGYGHMFIGPVDVVEGALRQSGQPDALKLADEDRFKKASAVIKNRGLAFGYSNTPASLEYYDWMVRNYDQIAKAQAEAALGGIEDPELREMMSQNMDTSTPEWMKSLPDLKILAKHMGDTVFEAHRVDDGVEMRTVVLRP